MRAAYARIRWPCDFPRGGLPCGHPLLHDSLSLSLFLAPPGMPTPVPDLDGVDEPEEPQQPETTVTVTVPAGAEPAAAATALGVGGAAVGEGASAEGVGARCKSGLRKSRTVTSTLPGFGAAPSSDAPSCEARASRTMPREGVLIEAGDTVGVSAACTAAVSDIGEAATAVGTTRPADGSAKPAGARGERGDGGVPGSKDGSSDRASTLDDGGGGRAARARRRRPTGR